MMAEEQISGSFQEIPILDFELLQSCRSEFFDKLRLAITDIGFLYAKNTKFPSKSIDDLVHSLPGLFRITDEEKQQIELEDSPHFLGFSTSGSETTAGQTDAREQYEFTSDPVARWSAGRPLYEKLQGPNQYPSSLPKTQRVVETYMDNMTKFAEDFMFLVAEALALPRDTFTPFLSHQNRLKVIHYPEAKNGGTCQGVGPHKDSSGWWTFLLQASPPEVKGLEVLNRAGQWVSVPNIPGTFVVNIGQAFEAVTHGACKATIHRVVGGPSERFSVAFFQGVRGNLSKEEALTSLAEHFRHRSSESEEGAQIDSPFLRGMYNTWGESQLRTKIRSHRKAGKKYYPEVYEQYINEDI